MADSLREPSDQTAIAWRDDAFLSTYPLDRRTVLDYFAGSPFYDRRCNNEVARSRGLGVESLPLMPAGPEYVLADCQEPHLFVIRRQLRGAPGTQPTPQAVYYVLDGIAYQAPAVASVLKARLDRCLFSARKAFERMQGDLDPLLSAERELERATKVASRAAKIEEEEEGERKGREEAAGASGGDAPRSSAKPLIPLALLAAPPRRLTEAEQNRLRRGERVVATVLSQFPMPKQQQQQAGR